MLQPSTVHTWRGRRGLTERVLDMATIDSTSVRSCLVPLEPEQEQFGVEWREGVLSSHECLSLRNSGTKKKYICGFTVHDAKELSQDFFCMSVTEAGGTRGSSFVLCSLVQP